MKLKSNLKNFFIKEIYKQLGTIWKDEHDRSFYATNYF